MPRGLPSGDTREGFALHLDWERALFDARYAVVSWPEAYGGRDASPDGVADLRGGVLPRRRPAAGHAERHLPARADRLRVRHRRRRRTTSSRAWPGATTSGARAGRSRTPAATSPASRAAAVRDEAAGGWRLSGQKTWTTRGAFCTHLFGLFRSDPEAERHRGLTYFLVPLDAPGRDGARLRPARRRRGLRRGLPRRRVRARRRRARRRARGLVGGDGHDERGARSHPAQPGPLPRRGRPARRPLPRLRRRRPIPACATP